MDFVYSNGVALGNKCIKNVLTKIFAFNHHFFLISMLLLIKSRKCINTISFLTNSGGDRSWIQTEHTGSTNYRNLRPFWNENCHVFLFKFCLNIGLEIGALRKTSYHKNEVYGKARCYSLLEELCQFLLNFLE